MKNCSCGIRASYGYPDGPRIACSLHKETGMVNLNVVVLPANPCSVPDCLFLANGRPFCYLHEVTKCEFCDGCAYYGYEVPHLCQKHRHGLPIHPTLACSKNNCNAIGLFVTPRHKRMCIAHARSEKSEHSRCWCGKLTINCQIVG